MQLGKKSGGGVDYLKEMQDAGEVVDMPMPSRGGAAAPVQPAGPVVKEEPVHLVIDEKLSVMLEREGGLASVCRACPTVHDDVDRSCMAHSEKLLV